MATRVEAGFSRERWTNISRDISQFLYNVLLALINQKVQEQEGITSFSLATTQLDFKSSSKLTFFVAWWFYKVIIKLALLLVACPRRFLRKSRVSHSGKTCEALTEIGIQMHTTASSFDRRRSFLGFPFLQGREQVAAPLLNPHCLLSFGCSGIHN